MTTLGYEAETMAATYLQRLGYTIIERNWRRPSCEIDLIVKRHKTIYLVEVKYRTRINQGSGLEYITRQKLTHMRRAAERWVQETKWPGNYQLAVVAILGPQFTVTDWLPLPA